MDRRIVAATLLSLLVISCTDDGGSASASELDGRTFLSASVDGHTLVANTQVSVSFAGNQIGADAGCNLLGAGFRIDDGHLLIVDGISATEMGCDPPRHAQDEWLIDFLQSEPRIAIDGDELIMATDDATLHLVDREVADPDRPLHRTVWRVDTIIQGDAASSVPDDAPVTLEFHDDGTLTATSAGCTSATLNVDVEDDSLRFAEFAIDAIGCPAPWADTVDVLSAGDARFSITADRLTITAGVIGLAAAAD